jgi:hypothetical protein
MNNPETFDPEKGIDIKEEPADKETLVGPLVAKKNQHLKVENPKSEQFTGRCTADEKERIQAAIDAHKRSGETFDIVRLTLKMLDYIENDFLQTFKTK